MVSENCSDIVQRGEDKYRQNHARASPSGSRSTRFARQALSCGRFRPGGDDRSRKLCWRASARSHSVPLPVSGAPVGAPLRAGVCRSPVGRHPDRDCARSPPTYTFRMSAILKIGVNRLPATRPPMSSRPYGFSSISQRRRAPAHPTKPRPAHLLASRLQEDVVRWPDLAPDTEGLVRPNGHAHLLPRCESGNTQ